jgi:hypothetical protein
LQILQKPMSSEELLKAVHTLLSQPRAAKA